ncbi:MAG: GNAT family N-acetyltransferase [Myxococcota bacterium]
MPHLTLARLGDYLRLCNPESDPETLEADLRRISAMVLAGERDLSRSFVVVDPDDGEFTAAIRLFPDQVGVLILSRPVFADVLGRNKAAAQLLDEVIHHLDVREPHIHTVGCRVHQPSRAPGMQALLEERGFVELGGRIEYKLPIAQLPPELPDSPFVWKGMTEVGFGEAARMLAVVAQGAPDWGDDEDPEAVVQGYLDDPELTADPDYIQVGFIDGTPAAFIVAQIDPSDGWSRISYMGLAPPFRGRGLGVHLHRHGFAMMRAQGGSLYHGGTALENIAMQRLFERHGCAVYARMVEMEWKRPEPESPSS